MTHNCRKQNRFLKQVTIKHKTLQRISDTISNEIVITISYNHNSLSTFGEIKFSLSVVLRDLQLISEEKI